MSNQKYQLQWEQFHLEATINNLNEIKAKFNLERPQIVAIDTETTGLNIIKDKPFLFIFAWKVPGVNVGRSFTIPYDAMMVKTLMEMFKQCTYLIGANLKYDLHMLRNGAMGTDYEINFNNFTNFTDIRILRRLTMEADASCDDERMALKQMAKKFIDVNAHDLELNIRTNLNHINLQKRKYLKAMLEPFNLKVSELEKIVNDCRYGVEALAPEVQQVYQEWLTQYGFATYYDVYMQYPEALTQYAAYDGIFTIELFLYLFERLEFFKMKYPKLWDMFLQENKLIKIYYYQERLGFRVDTDYLKQTREKLANYMLYLKAQLKLLLEQDVSENQHKVLMEIFQKKWNINPEVFINKKENKLVFNKTVIHTLYKHPNQQVQTAAKIIEKLRTCRKWVSTYVDGIYKKVMENGDGRYHPTSNQVGTVSGRISGDFQQFPKETLYDLNGEELFHPRKAIIPSDNYELIFQDYDAMEMRVQAHYTIHFNCLDNNLCKMFIPLKYIHYLTGELFDFHNETHLQQLNDLQPNGKSVWVDALTYEPWIPIDPHGMQVKSAFGIDESNPNWKRLRSAAKTINFAVNYGSGLNSLLQNEHLKDYDDETITKIFNSYKTNFAGVEHYKRVVNNIINKFLCLDNIYGRLYRFFNPNNAYKCANYLVQGSCADLIKQCLIKIYDYLIQNHCKSRLIYTIHDEIIWEVHQDEKHIIKDIEKILNTTAKWCFIPLTCSTDIATTNWAEKYKIEQKNFGG